MSLEKIDGIAARVLGIEKKKITDALKRDSIREWDSFNHLMLMSEIEKELGITFSTKDIEQAKTIKDIKDLARKRQHYGQ